MARSRLALAFAVLVLCALGARPADAQTPEQRYGQWVRRLDFRPQEYLYRRSHMLRLLAESGGGLLLVPSSDGRTAGSTFRQLDDFWYFTGIEVPGSMLVLDADRNRSTLYLPETDYRFESPARPNDFPGRPLLDDYQLRSITGIEAYRNIADLESLIDGYARGSRTIRVNTGTPGPVSAPDIPLVGALDPTQTLLLKLRTDHQNAHVANAFEETARLRMVKTPAEIQRLRIAADVTTQAIRTAAARIRVGVDERSIQGAFEETCRALGSQRIPFTPIVKSGPNSLWPWRVLAAHYDRRNRPMESDELVILDVGCEIDGYVSDVGRTFPVTGRFTYEQHEKLMVSVTAADAIIAAVRPGVTFADLTRVAYEAIPDHEEPYMQTGSFFGHHIGLSPGDPALPDAPLEPGMVFTVEPWYYNHELGVAVFVEDVVLVTDDGAEVLTAALGRSPQELEAMIR
jgi:Xaa-Pro aminopeptidase